MINLTQVYGTTLPKDVARRVQHKCGAVLGSKRHASLKVSRKFIAHEVLYTDGSKLPCDDKHCAGPGHLLFGQHPICNCSFEQPTPSHAANSGSLG